MKYLIDTHIFLWYIEENTNISPSIASEIRNLDNTIFLSKASLWEIIIKSSSGKLELKKSLKELEDFIILNKFILLDIEFSHLQKLRELLFFHRDPFDRLIVAQAIAEDYTLISDDKLVNQYPVKLF